MAKTPKKKPKPARFRQEYRLQALSLRQITAPFAEAVLRVDEDYHDRDGRKRTLKPGTLINALALAFVELPPARQRKVALDALARLLEFREALGCPEEAEESDAGDCDGVHRGNDAAEVAPRPPGARKPARRRSG